MLAFRLYKFGNYFAKQICKKYFPTNIMYIIEACTGIKISTLYEEGKIWDEAVDHEMLC